VKKPTKAEMANSLDSFAIIDDAPQREVIDRSTLEAWANCPWQAHAIETADPKLIVGQLAVAGQFAHDCFHAATKAWIENGGYLRDFEMVKLIEEAMHASRPDLQPDVVKAVQPAMWDWARYLIKDCHPNNIACFDGGDELDRSGQLSCRLGVIDVSSELDFLRFDGPEAYEDDFKTGWRPWEADDVRNAFQFQFHAMLVFHNFPNVRTLRTRIWNTRRHTTTAWVRFDREDDPQYVARVHESLAVRERGELVTWPTLEKCRICPVKIICPAADDVVKLVEPQAMLTRLIALDAQADAIKAELTAIVDATQKEIVLADGTAFGRNKPSSVRKQPVAIYTKPDDWADPPFAKEKP